VAAHELSGAQRHVGCKTEMKGVASNFTRACLA